MQKFINLINNNHFQSCVPIFSLEDSNLTDQFGNNLLMILAEKRIEITDEDLEIKLFKTISSLLILNVFDLKKQNEMGDTLYSIIESSIGSLEYRIKHTKIMLRRISGLMGDDSIKKTIREYNSEEFKDINHLISGGYGTIYEANLDNIPVILKKSKHSSDLTIDLFKEILISKNINSDYLVNFFGVLQGQILVSEFYEYELRDIINYLINFNDEIKHMYILKLFKNIILAANEMNKAGYCHFDLKPSNIMVTSNLKIKLIDLGISSFSGLEINELESFLGTVNIRPPDVQQLDKNYYDKNMNIVFKKDEYKVNYSSDMFSIACFLLGTILYYKKRSSLQLLYLKNVLYIFEKEEKSSILEPISEDDLQIINSYSPYLLNFLLQAFMTDQEDRLTCKDALNHPLFGDGIVSLPNYYSITDIYSTTFEKDIYPSRTIRYRNGKLKYLDEIFKFYSSFVIPKNEKKYIKFRISGDYDSFLNALCFCSSSTLNLNLNDIYECILPLKKSKLEPSDIDYEVKKEIIFSTYKYIPFRTMIIAFVCKLREESVFPKLISEFHNNIYSYLHEYILKERNESISVSIFLNQFYSRLREKFVS